MTDTAQPSVAQQTTTAHPPITGKLSVQIEQFPNNPPGKQSCFVWTKKDGTRQVFGCDTQENCQAMLPHWQNRARTAEQNNWDAL